MIVRYLYILLFTSILFQSSAQNTYSDRELQDFVDIYMTYKQDKKRNTAADKMYFDDYDVTPKRYREISQSSLSNRSISLTSNEVQLLAEIKKQNDLLKDSNRRLLEKICKNNNTSYAKYSSILDRYQKDIQFQRSLKPHFEAFIKSMK